MLSHLRFVRSGKDDALVQQAVEAIQRHGSEPVWVDGESEQQSKSCIYVLDNFDVPLYKSLAGNYRLIGPSVVLAHLKHKWPLPASTQPVFSMAMHGVVACFTQLGTQQRRSRLSELVKLMGGTVRKDFTRHVTHVVAGQVGSTKYTVARQLGIPVFLPSWVETCWEEGFSHLVSATDQNFLSAHRCPPFTGCTICVTGLEEKARKRVSDLCEENGGTYSGELTKDVCTHLLVGNTNSTKYKYARQWQTHCVTPQWLYDSIESGYCLPEKDYNVETQGAKKEAKSKEEEGREWVHTLEEFKVPSVSENYFLDGCKIYFSGFTEEQLEKLYRIVNLGGGTRYNHLSENLSHVVMGNQEGSEVTAIQRLGHCPHVVSPQWLLDSCTGGERAGEKDFICLQLQQPSPMPIGRRKRKMEGAESEGASKRLKVEADEEDEEDLIMQYQNAELPAKPEGVLYLKELSVSALFALDDRKIALDVVCSHGGRVVSPPSGDYHIVPLELTEHYTEQVPAVTLIWLQRCLEAGRLLDPSSYFLFQPMTTPINDSTLTGCVLAFSQFSDLEREHLVRFSKGLGATVQDHFAHYPGHGLLATTHLVLKQPSGDKYNFALKWEIPAVADSWLFACAVAQRITEVDDHLIRTGRNPVSLSEEEEPPTADEKDGTEPPTDGREPPREETGGMERMEIEDNEGKDSGGGKLPDLENFKPNFNLTEAFALIPPYTPSVNTQLEAIFKENFAVALQNVEKIEQEDARRASLFNGVVLCVNKKLASQEAHLHNQAGSLGADYRWAFDETCTHYIYQGKVSEAARDRELKTAKGNGCTIVSPHWISACVESGSRVDESLYPHTYDPSMALSGISVHKATVQHTQTKEAPSNKTPEQQNNSVLRDDIPRYPITGKQVEPELPVEMSTHSAENRHEDNRPDPHEDSRPDPHEDSRPDPHEDNHPDRHEDNHPDPHEDSRPDRPEDTASDVAKMFQKQLEEIKEAPKDLRKRRSKRLLKKDDESLPPPPRPLSRTGRNRRGRRNRKKEEELPESQVSDSQILQVTYDDPEGRREKEKILAQIEMEEAMKRKGLDPKQLQKPDHLPVEEPLVSREHGTEPSTSHPVPVVAPKQIECNIDRDVPSSTPAVPSLNVPIVTHSKATSEGIIDRDVPSSTPAVPSLNVPIVTHSKATSEVKSLYDERTVQTHPQSKSRVPPKLLLSSLEQREKVDYGALIQELGGEYIDLDYFTTECSHLVVGKASRTEKYLGACAAGKWVLHKSYLEECRAAGEFVAEEEHEWGVSVGGQEVTPLESAPRKWRVRLTQASQDPSAGVGAFQDWTVLLFTERNKLPGLKRLLEAGGAHVLPNSKLTPEDLMNVTHAFINMNHFPKDTITLESLVHGGVHCLKPDYIAEYLSKGIDTPVEVSYIAEAKALLQR